MTKQMTSPLWNWTAQNGLPDFSAFKDEDFDTAFHTALAASEQEIETLAVSQEQPTIDNFLRPFELAGKALERVCAIFGLYSSALSTPFIQQLEQKFVPILSRYASKIMMDARLFQKIDDLYQKTHSSTNDTSQLCNETTRGDDETKRVIELHWKAFVRSGAKLNDKDKQRLAHINAELASLGATFGQNVLKDEAEWVYYLEQGDLDGLPDSLRSTMKEIAIERGQADYYALILTRSVIEPFLLFSARRDLRALAFHAWAKRGANGNDHDNSTLMIKVIALRNEKAKLLGYRSFADYKLDDTMAKTPEAVIQLLSPVWESAKRKANAEKQELQQLMQGAGENGQLQPWDWRFYSEKLRAQRFDFDENTLKPYLQLDQMIAAAFDCATKLFGLQFEEKHNVTLWHQDARLFEVKNADGTLKGIFIGDYFARSSKRSGAWMSALQLQYNLADGQIPIIYNMCNFAKPAAGQKALLSLDDARTLFHEFGHALHGLLSDVTWPSISGTSVARDFVELPSQLYEHWLTVRSVLEKFALHEQTGQAIPAPLLDKVLQAQTFNAGFDAVEFTASALIDMQLHRNADITDLHAFERRELEKLGMPDAIIMRHRPWHFNHIFSGDGYAAGYYSYMWSEVLDADAFAAFEEKGDPFDRSIADKLKKFIYSAGGSHDPEALYKAFRGKLPSPNAMMAKRGL